MDKNGSCVWPPHLAPTSRRQVTTSALTSAAEGSLGKDLYTSLDMVITYRPRVRDIRVVIP